MRFVAFIFILTVQLLGSDIRVIMSINCTIESLKYFELKEMFLKDRTKVDDINVVSLDNKNKSIQKEFIEKYLNKTQGQMRAYWARMVFTGDKTPPMRVDVANFENTLEKCYISYTKDEKIPKNWKIINIDEK